MAEKRKYDGGGGGSFGGGGGKVFEGENQENKLYVGNLDSRVSEYMIIKLFKKYGEIVKVIFMWHQHGPKRGQPRGYCFVEFSRRGEAIAAKNALNGRTVLNRTMTVRSVNDRVMPGAGINGTGTGTATIADAGAGETSTSSDTEPVKPVVTEAGLDMKMDALRAKIAAMKEETRQLKRARE